jgi:hypothetical protein
MVFSVIYMKLVCNTPVCYGKPKNNILLNEEDIPPAFVLKDFCTFITSSVQKTDANCQVKEVKFM